MAGYLPPSAPAFGPPQGPTYVPRAERARRLDLLTMVGLIMQGRGGVANERFGYHGHGGSLQIRREVDRGDTLYFVQDAPGGEVVFSAGIAANGVIVQGRYAAGPWEAALDAAYDAVRAFRARGAARG